MQRRFFLRGAAALGCSAAAHPWMTTLTLAGSAGGRPLGEHRLIVIILRGAMDGLDLARPVGDPLFAGYRPTLGGGGAFDLDGYFALHPGLPGLMPLWAAGELALVHATSTPYRDQRSHFVGQDILEAGTGRDVPPGAVRDGWLNRMLQGVPGLRAETAFAIGLEAVPLLEGRAPVLSWAPETRLDLSAQARLLFDEIYHEDPLFQAAALDAMALSAPGALAEGPQMAGAHADTDALAAFAAARLREETRIAAFSLAGWDTHRAQERGIGKALARLERVILGLKAGLGAQAWGQTTLLAMTEFGRTVRENGSAGTDHGTGGAMIVAGGAVRGGRVLGRWPGIGEPALYEGRDLLPTTDVRHWAGWAMRGLYGFEPGLLERVVFPGLDLGTDPGLLR